MPDRTYRLVYVVDDAQATTKLADIRKGIVSVDYAARGGKKGIDDLATSMAGLGAQVQAVGTNLPGFNAQLNTINTQLNNVAASTKGAADSMHGLMPAWQVWEYGIQLAGKFGEYMNAAREQMRELARDAAETRDQFRELANLQGHHGPDDEVLAETINMGMEAGMMPDDARRFMEQFEGSIPAGRTKGNIQPNVEKELAQEGMKFGTRVKLNPNTAGDLAGILPQYGKINSVEEGAGQMGKIAHGLNEGRGNLEPLVRSLIKTAGSIVDDGNGGAVPDLPELAAILGVASTNATPDRAGTMVVNAVRGLRQFSYKAQTKEEIKANAPRQYKAQGEALKGMGITPQMKFKPALDIIAPRITDADKSGLGGDVYLRQHGFDNEDEIKGLVQLARNMKVVNQRIADERKQGDGKKVMADNEAFYNQEKAGINRRVRARKTGQEQLIGMRGEYSEMAMESGMQAMRENKQLGGFGNKLRFFAEDVGGLLPFLGSDTAQNKEAKEAFMHNLDAEGRKVGVDVHKIYERHGHKIAKDNKGNYVDAFGDRQFKNTAALNEAVEAVMEAGGKPFGDAEHVKAAFRKAADQDKAHHAKMAVPAAQKKIAIAAQDAKADAEAKEWAAAERGAVARTGVPMRGVPIDKKLQEMIDQQKKTNDILNQKAGVPLAPGGRQIAPGRK